MRMNLSTCALNNSDALWFLCLHCALWCAAEWVKPLRWQWHQLCPVQLLTVHCPFSWMDSSYWLSTALMVCITLVVSLHIISFLWKLGTLSSHSVVTFFIQSLFYSISFCYTQRDFLNTAYGGNPVRYRPSS